ncbi:MAG: myo-inosose-2 dehydratase [Pseudomonadota bacterium]|nr:myo-inosose-2 dehydratase [Pseudomonadota bacterium]
MEARVGIAPIAWSNDDLPELGGQTSLETCLSEAKAAGFSGVETGGKFPKTYGVLEKTLKKHNLLLCGGWYSGTLLDNSVEKEKERVTSQLNLFKALNAPCLVYGETAGTIQNLRNRPLSSRRVLSEEQIKTYGSKITSFAEWCQDQGMPITFHHHMGTAIETQSDVDLLMKYSGEALKLLFDAGHLHFAGGNALSFINKHHKRISHVHTKDVRANIINSLNKDKESFLDAVLKGAFTVPGDGSLDFDKIVKALYQKGYKGWFVVEAEQDPKISPPYEFACIGHKALTKALHKAGYKILNYYE